VRNQENSPKTTCFQESSLPQTETPSPNPVYVKATKKSSEERHKNGGNKYSCSDSEKATLARPSPINFFKSG
jgi:hypothetical protein